MTTPWGILALILSVQTVANIGPMGLPAIAPLIRDDLRLSLTQAGSFLSAYYVGPILMSLPAGWLADRWGIRRTMVAGQLLIALGLTAAAFAGSFDPGAPGLRLDRGAERRVPRSLDRARRQHGGRPRHAWPCARGTSALQQVTAVGIKVCRGQFETLED
ncbi:MAG: MFS transporter [Candidatus Rokubacteria bacterium]|nr:MFS transporter [Candidatus Rokubacteria bacterium]